MIVVAAGPRDLGHDGAAMTVQLWKRGDEDPRVTFRCPWCDVVGVSAVHGRYEQRRMIWLLAACPNIPCGRGVLISVPSKARWSELDTGDEGLLLAPSCVFPRDELVT